MQLNEFQQAAVNEPPKNITVSAAAGSGKTQVLGARVLCRISGEAPVDVNRLLIVTFTKAAAAEMRSRISRSISEALRTETDKTRRRSLERQLSLLGSADICTIDSFCYRLLKQNFFRIPGLSGDFSVGNEDSVRDISSEALRTGIEMFSAALQSSRSAPLIAHYKALSDEFYRLYPDKDKADKILEGFAALAENYGSAKRTEDFLTQNKAASNDYIDFIRKIKREADSSPAPEKLLERCALQYSPDLPFDKTELGLFAAREAAQILKDIRLKVARELEVGGLNSNNTAAFTRLLESLDAIEAPSCYSDAVKIFDRPFPFEGRITSKDTKKEKGDPHAVTVRDEAAALWKAAASLLKAPNTQIELFREKMYPIVLAICELVRYVTRLEAQKMLEKKRLSFSLCVRLTLDLLTAPDEKPSETALELQNYYDEIYVDEAQDIEPRQLAIFKAISKGNLFMVGDVKQSIYGFRHAEPELFNSRCKTEESFRLISMNWNYRSNEVIISAVNEAFWRLMNKATMNIDYCRDHSMVHKESWLPKAPCAEFVSVIDTESRKKYKFELEARVIAERISRLIDSKLHIFDKDTQKLRPVEYKDIIVLFRANTDIPALESVLTKSNIPCYCDVGRELFSRREIAGVIDVLSLIDDPLKDIPLAGTLRGLMFGFGENELLKLRSVSRSDSFSSIFYALSRPEHENHLEYAQRLDDEKLLERCMAVGALMKKWKSAADFRPISEVIGMIMTDTGFYSAVGALPSGTKRRANLDLLCAMADSFEAAGSRGLYSFIDYIQKRSLAGGSETEAKTLSDSMNVVRLMTIHKSKGLEAPVVIITRCSASFRQSTAALAIDPDLGFTFDYINEDKGYKYRSPFLALLRHKLQIRERAEEARLLYVAMTRPRELLICTGYFYNQKAYDALMDFNGELSHSDLTFLANSYAKMLGSSVAEGKIDGIRPIWKRVSVDAESAARLEPAQPLKVAAPTDSLIEDMSALLSFTYKYENASLTPAKISVSALKQADYDDAAAPTEFSTEREVKLRRPLFLGDEPPITNAMLGTAYHAIMEAIDFNAPVSPQIDSLAERGIILPSLRKLILDERITALLNGPLGLRMRRAKKLWREAPFMITIPSAQAFENAPQDTSVAVQGVIDCFFEEGDTVVIVDYKTDRYSDPEELVQKYKKQLYYYAKAIMMKFSDKKVQKYLYLFHKGDIIEVD